MSVCFRTLLSLLLFGFTTSTLVAQTAGQNLIPMLDLKLAQISGNWTKTDRQLTVSGKNARLMLPMNVAGSYSVTIEFTRKSGDQSIGVILPVGSRQCLLNLSLFQGEAHGIGLIDGKLARNNQTTRKPGTLKNNHPYRLIIEVDLNQNKASIAAELDGRPLFNWQGNPESLSLHEVWKLPQTDRVGLYTNADVTFHSLQFTRLSPNMRMIKPAVAKKEAQNAANTPVLLYDLMHGERPAVGLDEMSKKQKFLVQNSSQSLTEDLLKQVDLLYLRGPAKAFSKDEQQAIIQFVQNGGALLLVMDEERRMSLAQTQVNQILAPFGMKLTDDLPYLHNCGAMAKAGLINASDRELPYSGGRAVTGGTSFAFQLDQAGKPAEAFAAYQQVKEGGKIIVLAEGMAAGLMGTQEGIRLSGVSRNPARTTYWGKDSVLFMNDVITWLLSKNK
ncbi:ABC-type uncharacterized transport system [Gimesia alba]|uniref:ABC-type uncharacterized transport system n=1 Tax=Gimesia alba TaxID=2527973 RepID=A0A517RDB9_9PLAN|nr:hypothetical protein [Gimesia alba]QDT41880.1 ABC-type uncharacterized transport system [Gimesia alba]